MKLVRWLILGVMALALVSVSSQAARAAEFAVIESNAVANFPTGITFNVSATSESPIVEAELLYTKANLETLNLSAATFEPATQVDISLPVDFRVNYVPAGIDLTYRWRFTDEAGDVVETEPRTVTWMDTRFDWKEVSSDQVTVYSYNGNEDFNRFILESAQSTIDQLQSDFKVERSRRIRLWVYDSKSDFQGSQAANSQEWIAGTAYPELQVILAVLPEGNEREVGRVVPHEISHQVLYQATQNPFNAPPTWLDEGLAVTAQASGNEDFQAMVERAADDGRLFSIRSLNSDFPYDPADASLAYAESYSIVQFIVGQWGNEGIGAMIDAYKNGVSHDRAALTALGVDLTELDVMWKEKLRYQGNNGVAGGTSGDGESWTNDLIVNASALVLVLLAFVSIVVMYVRHRGARDYDDPELTVVSA